MSWDILEDFEERPAAWELKPTEKVCKVCWLVQPCDCEANQ